MKKESDVVQDDAFSYGGYEMVRQEFCSHVHEPSITFTYQTVSVNTACLKRLPEVDYVQILINQGERKLVVRPSHADEKDSFAWCTRNANRSPRQITGRIFTAKVMHLMGWEPSFRYKLLGKLICGNGHRLFIFDLTMPIYQRISSNEEKLNTLRLPMFPAEWRDRFGLPVEEHRERFHVKIFNDYAVFGIKHDPNPGLPNEENIP